jgi:hypothetical protein
MKAIDITGQRFGKLLAVGKSANTSRTCFTVICDCGTVKEVQARHLRSGAIVSCGCHRRSLATSHGMNGTRPYNIWRGMLDRCRNPSRKEFKNYGGKGITVCQRWLEFSSFWEDMEIGYSDDLTLDRIKNDRGYEPGNCRWATKTEQARNTSRNRLVNLDSRQVCISEAAEIVGVNRFALRARAEKGESGERLFAKRIASGRKKSGESARPILEEADTAALAVALAVIKAKEQP